MEGALVDPAGMVLVGGREVAVRCELVEVGCGLRVGVIRGAFVGVMVGVRVGGGMVGTVWNFGLAHPTGDARLIPCMMTTSRATRSA